MISISQTVHVDIAHFLPGHPIDENRRVHGHSLAITVKLSGEREPGVVQDFSVFKAQMEIIAGLIDHRLLNAIDGLDYPTLECIAGWFATRMRLVDERVTLVRVERGHLGQVAEWTL